MCKRFRISGVTRRQIVYLRYTFSIYFRINSSRTRTHLLQPMHHLVILLLLPTQYTLLLLRLTPIPLNSIQDLAHTLTLALILILPLILLQTRIILLVPSLDPDHMMINPSSLPTGILPFLPLLPTPGLNLPVAPNTSHLLLTILSTRRSKNSIMKRDSIILMRSKRNMLLHPILQYLGIRPSLNPARQSATLM